MTRYQDAVTRESGEVIEDDGYEVVIDFGDHTEVWTHEELKSSTLEVVESDEE